MRPFRKAVLVFVAFSGLGAAALLLSGCTTKTEADSDIPWSQPASWEGGIPGMDAMTAGQGSPGGTH